MNNVISTGLCTEIISVIRTVISIVNIKLLCLEISSGKSTVKSSIKKIVKSKVTVRLKVR